MSDRGRAWLTKRESLSLSGYSVLGPLASGPPQDCVPRQDELGIETLGESVMLHGMSPNGIGLANTALVVSVIRGLISKGLIDRAEARLWLNNAATLIEEDKTAFTKSRGEAITIIREELVQLLD